MNLRRVLLVLLLAAAAGQLAVPVSMIAGRELTLRTGKAFRFHVRPVDPLDPFRGRYVALSIEPSRFTNSSPGPTVYVSTRDSWVLLDVDAAGYAKVTNVVDEEPSSGDWIKVPTHTSSSNVRAIEWPFDRYYMEETKAPEAERAWNRADASALVTNVEAPRRRQAASVVVRVRKGSAVIQRLDIDGRPVEESMRNAGEDEEETP